jgi:nitroreductase
MAGIHRIGLGDGLDPGRNRRTGRAQIPVSILPIGYEAEKPARTERRSLEDLVHPVDSKS